MLPRMDLLVTAMVLLLVVQNPGGVSRPRRDKHDLCRHARTVTLRGAPSPATDLSLMLQMMGAKVASFGRCRGCQGAAGCYVDCEVIFMPIGAVGMANTGSIEVKDCPWLGTIAIDPISVLDYVSDH